MFPLIHVSGAANKQLLQLAPANILPVDSDNSCLVCVCTTGHYMKNCLSNTHCSLLLIKLNSYEITREAETSANNPHSNSIVEPKYFEQSTSTLNGPGSSNNALLQLQRPSSIFKTNVEKIGTHIDIQENKCQSVEEEIIECSGYPNETNSRDNRRTCVKTHLAGQEKPYGCAQCSYRTNAKGSLQRHFKTHQSGREKPFGCAHCSYKTDRKGSILIHLKTHQF